jgi:hypothetical protein
MVLIQGVLTSHVDPRVYRSTRTTISWDGCSSHHRCCNPCRHIRACRAGDQTRPLLCMSSHRSIDWIHFGWRLDFCLRLACHVVSKISHRFCDVCRPVDANSRRLQQLLCYGPRSTVSISYGINSRDISQGAVDAVAACNGTSRSQGSRGSRRDIRRAEACPDRWQSSTRSHLHRNLPKRKAELPGR